MAANGSMTFLLSAPGDGPDEAAELARHCDDRHLARLAARGEAEVAAVEPLLGFPGVGDDLRGLALPAGYYRFALPRRVAVVPGSLDQGAASVGVAGLGDAASSLLAAARAFAGDEADEGHELAGVLEASEVADLRDEDDGGEGVPLDRGPEGLALGGGGKVLVEGLEPPQRALQDEVTPIEASRRYTS